MSKYETEEQACRAWVASFNAIPSALLKRAFTGDKMDDLELLAGGKVVSDCCDAECSNIPGVPEPMAYSCDACGDACDTHTTGPEYDWPAGWGTLWNPNESIDEEWIRENAEKVAALGFLVYESEETGILLGIDGGGYDFHAEHWIPLYRLRGLKWHATAA